VDEPAAPAKVDWRIENGVGVFFALVNPVHEPDVKFAREISQRQFSPLSNIIEQSCENLPSSRMAGFVAAQYNCIPIPSVNTMPEIKTSSPTFNARIFSSAAHPSKPKSRAAARDTTSHGFGEPRQ
jgi:hypothetical protein